MSRWGSGFFKTHKTPEFHWDPLNVAAYQAVLKLEQERQMKNNTQLLHQPGLSLLSDLLAISGKPLGSRTETKQCRRCLEIKAESDFYPRSDNDGTQPYCKSCMKKYKKERRANGKKN